MKKIGIAMIGCTLRTVQIHDVRYGARGSLSIAAVKVVGLLFAVATKTRKWIP